MEGVVWKDIFGKCKCGKVDVIVSPLQRFPFGRDNLKNILVRPFKFGMWVYMGSATNAIGCDLDLQFQAHWWPLKSKIFLHFGPVLIYRKLDHRMGGIYNTYICPL